MGADHKKSIKAMSLGEREMGGRWERWMVRKRRGRDGGGVERRVVNGRGDMGVRAIGRDGMLEDRG